MLSKKGVYVKIDINMVLEYMEIMKWVNPNNLMKLVWG